MGHPRRGDPRTSRAPESRTDPASPRHPGVRAGADRGQGDPIASAGLHGVQRRLRRRPNGRSRAALHRGTARSARADDVVEQHSLARQRRSHHRTVAGRGARALLHDPRARGSQGRGHGIQRRGRSASCLREPQRRSAGQGQSAPIRMDSPREGRRLGEEHASGRHHGGPGLVVRDSAARAVLRCHQPGHDQPSMPSTRT